MPKLYEYLGLIILFYSHEHEPIHVHCKFQGKEPLDSQNLKKFKKLVETYRDDIVRKWVDFFVYNKPIESERITKKL